MADEWISADSAAAFHMLISGMFPLILLISVSYHLARARALNPMVVITLSIAVLFSLDAGSTRQVFLLGGLSTEFHLIVVFIAPLAVWSLVLVSMVFRLFMPVTQHYGYSSGVMQSVGPFLVVFLMLSVLMQQLSVLGAELIAGGANWFSGVDANYAVPLLIAVEHIIWWFGLHGSGVVYEVLGGLGVMGREFSNGLSAKQFFDLFAIYGGSGAGISLILSVLLFSRDTYSRSVAKVAVPFSLFNVNEVLIYGLPIILNRYLLIPFLLVPLINLFLARILISILSVEFTAIDIPWTTPVFINAYLATEGNIWALLVQAFLIITGVAIYSPFIRAFTASQSRVIHQRVLTDALDVDIDSEKNEQFSRGQKSSIAENDRLVEALGIVREGALEVHYQPIVALGDQSARRFEALLRVRKSSGELCSPIFLESIERANLSTVVDLWVCREVFENYSKWEGNPQISINIHPTTLGNYQAVSRVIETVGDRNIRFEVVERGVIDAPDTLIGISRLKDAGFPVSLDDFGSGYSSLSLLHSLPASSVKIDKSLIDKIGDTRQEQVVFHVVSMLKALGYEVVAEGVEEVSQLEYLRALGVDYIQGWYFSKALPQLEAKGFNFDYLLRPYSKPGGLSPL